MSVIRRKMWFLIGPFVVLAVALSLRTGSGQNAAPVEKDVVYGEAGGQKLLLDVYHPAVKPENGALLPAVVWVHGGGWAGGNKRDFGDLAAGLT